MAVLTTHDLARLLLSRQDAKVQVLESYSCGYGGTCVIFRDIELVPERDIFSDGTTYGTGIEIDRNGNVWLGEKG